jgi:DNA-binding NarL/FixJ family response regulator
MRYPQLLVYEHEGLLANLVRRAELNRDWSLREPRRPEACLRLLRQGGPSILVLEAGRDVEREMTLLERVSWLYPETRTVVVGDAENAALAGLAWDLGAAFVLLPPLPRDLLLDVLRRLMAKAVGSAAGPAGGPGDA